MLLDLLVLTAHMPETNRSRATVTAWWMPSKSSSSPAAPTPAPRPRTRASSRSSAPAAATATRPATALVSCSPAPPGRQRAPPSRRDRSQEPRRAGSPDGHHRELSRLSAMSRIVSRSAGSRATAPAARPCPCGVLRRPGRGRCAPAEPRSRTGPGVGLDIDVVPFVEVPRVLNLLARCTRRRRPSRGAGRRWPGPAGPSPGGRPRLVVVTSSPVTRRRQSACRSRTERT